jgi:S1-C subfamily serine protease
MRRLRQLLLTGLLLCGLSALPLAAEPLVSPANPEAPARRVLTGGELYQHVLTGVAEIRSDFGSGTGWLISKKDRLMVTNHHVVAKNQRRSKELLVVFPVRNEQNEIIPETSYYNRNLRKLGIPARIVYTSADRDLALIQLERVPEGAMELPLAAGSIKPGEAVCSVGNPGKSEALWVFNSGTVRQIYRKKLRYSSGQQVQARVVETQQPIAGGDSGSPMVNERGEVVGVVCAGQEGAPLFNYAIDLAELKAFLADAKEADRQEEDQDEPRRGRKDKHGTPVDRDEQGPPSRRGGDGSGKGGLTQID